MSEDKDISELMQKAKESLEAAKSLHRDGFYGFSAARSYYSMFYVAEALLLTKNLSFSKHSAVIGAFGKERGTSYEICRTLHPRAKTRPDKVRHGAELPLPIYTTPPPQIDNLLHPKAKPK